MIESGDEPDAFILVWSRPAPVIRPDKALRRARELIENGDYHAVAMHDGIGSVLTGVLPQLKLGAAIAD